MTIDKNDVKVKIDVETSVKSGVKTSEFWVTALSMPLAGLVVYLVSSLGFDLKIESVIEIINNFLYVAVSYVVGRSAVKSVVINSLKSKDKA